MKMNIDKSFKKSLEGHEYPYDAAAWKAMNKRLDQTMPSGSGSTWKWFLGGAAVVGVVVTSATLLNSGEQAQKIAQKVEQTVVTNGSAEDNQSTSAATANQFGGNGTILPASTQEGSQADQQSEQVGSSVSTEEQRSNQVNKGVDQQSGKTTTQNQNPEDSSTPGGDTQKPEKTKEIVLPILENACQGETVKIDNRNNDVAIYVIDPSNNRTTVKAGTKSSIELAEDGTYTIAHIENGTILKKETFLALTAPKVDISYDRDRPFDDGVPTTNLTTNAIGTSYEWSFPSIKQKATGKEVKAHFFKDGEHDVKLTITGSNGCKATETVKVEINNNYNLLAEGQFNPNSTIAVNRAFMPDALVLRNTPFTLYIIEPSTGAVIYETSDASQPWTGIDKRNGQMVAENSTLVWKVVLQNPLEGEKSNYAGTIFLSSNR